MSFKKEVLEKLDKLADKQQDHTIELAKNTMVLNEHHVRSTNHEARLKPLEDHVKFIQKSMKVFGWLIAVGAGLAAIARYLGI